MTKSNKDNGGMDIDDTGRNAWTKLAECVDCRWVFREHNFRDAQADETESRTDVTSRQAMMHSKITGHAVRYVDTGTE